MKLLPHMTSRAVNGRLVLKDLVYPRDIGTRITCKQVSHLRTSMGHVSICFKPCRTTFAPTLLASVCLAPYLMTFYYETLAKLS